MRVALYLAIIAGLINGFSSLLVGWSKYAELSRFGQFSVIISELVIAVLFVIVYLYLVSWVYRLAGSWLKGTGDYKRVKTAVGCSLYPWCVTGVVGTLIFLAQNPLAQRVLSILYFVLAIWSFIIFLKLLAEAHHFSSWRALASFMIVLLIVIAIGLIVRGTLTLFKGAAT
ncbi:MAG: hypothetical protein S4CHLAM81_05510 [Chlamydiales bacterium]|nr:hypothetical protein [Chlamydiales bacterium]MCH9635336.1 hypothetical protein [Chlamydiales bacterium]